MTQLDETAATIVEWAKRQGFLAKGPRVNVRLDMGSQSDLCARVRETLERESTPEVVYVVRNSAEADAVRMRNGRPQAASRGARIFYLLFWIPSARGHANNAASLSDLRLVSDIGILADSANFVLLGERTIWGQCDEAAEAWAKKDREVARQHLRACWDALRTCLRERRGGREGSTPFVRNLQSYLVYLKNSLVPVEEWTKINPARRASVMIGRWGAELHWLSMFTAPALPQILKVHVDSTTAVRKGDHAIEKQWQRELQEILGQNLDCANDFSTLADVIAGKLSVSRRLEELAERNVRLHRSDPVRARESLVRFCESGDPQALKDVEWLFPEDEGNPRSPSQGLKGLLIARKRRAPRENPIERAASETTLALKIFAGEDSTTVSRFTDMLIERRSQLERDPRRAEEIALWLRSVVATGVGEAVTAPSEQDGTREAERARSSAAIERACGLWEKIAAEARGDDAIQSENILLGLAQICLQNLPEESDAGLLSLRDEAAPDEMLVVRVEDESEGRGFELETSDWSVESQARLHAWLRDHVCANALDEPEEEDEDEEQDLEPREIRLVVYRRARRAELRPLGTIALQWRQTARRVLVSTRSEVLTSWSTDLGEREQPNPVRMFVPKNQVPESPAGAVTLNDAWAAYRASLDNGRAGWDVAALAGPVPKEARQWVECWYKNLELIDRATKAGEIRKRQDQITKEILEADQLRAGELAKELAILMREQPETAPSLDDVRGLLRLCTGKLSRSGAVEKIVLSPHHPLVLRLRALSDDILGSILSHLWTDGWPAAGLSDLRVALRNWGLPEPARYYGFWDAKPPLVFDAWVVGAGALFSKLGAGREADARKLGANLVADVVESYSRLFPASAQRLRMRVHGDEQGAWAWEIVKRCTDDAPEFCADADVETSMPERDSLEIERRLIQDQTYLERFEPRDDGRAPQIRVRRVQPGERNDRSAHLNLVVGSVLPEFQPRLEPVPESGGTAVPLWDSRVFFLESMPLLAGYTFAIGERNDELCRRVSRAVGYACTGFPQVFVEKQSFDETSCEAPLQRLHSGTHWLVLASREPLYPAVQRVSGTIASLLDFYSEIESGRPVHVCVSLSADRANHDLRRLEVGLRALMGPEAGGLNAGQITRAALKLAPGLAMQCVSATGMVRLEGLLGLLLSASLFAQQLDRPHPLILALDQHRELLDQGGQWCDLLAVWLDGSEVRIRIAEAKFSTNPVDTMSPLIVGAGKQIDSTIRRLTPLSLNHPLKIRVRSKLARAILHGFHLGFPNADESKANQIARLVEAVLDTGAEIRIEPREKSEIIAWSLGQGTTDKDKGTPNQGRVLIRGRDSTLDGLRRLGT